jgi:hypothetical protein
MAVNTSVLDKLRSFISSSSLFRQAEVWKWMRPL